MTTIELKSDLFNKINALGRNKLVEIKGYIENLEQEEIELLDWIQLSENQKIRLKDSIAQLDEGKFSTH